MDERGDLERYWDVVGQLKAQLRSRIDELFPRSAGGMTAFAYAIDAAREWVYQVLACARTSTPAAMRWVEVLVPNRSERDRYVAALVGSEQLAKRPSLILPADVLDEDRADALYVAGVRFHEAALAAAPFSIDVERRRAVATLAYLTEHLREDGGSLLLHVKADAYMRLSDLYNWQDELESALAATQRALVVAKPSGDLRLIGEAHRARGTVYTNLDRGDLALPDFNDAMAIYLDDADPGLRLLTVRGLMNAWTSAGDPERAIEFGGAFRDEVERQPDPALTIVYYEGLARAHLRADQADEANRILKQGSSLLPAVESALHRLIFLSTSCAALTDPDECEMVASRVLAETDPRAHLRQRRRIEKARERARRRRSSRSSSMI